jgi:hydrogenase expression/formation protein HypD
MKYLTEFRNGEIAQRLAREISAITTRPWKIMEVCGGQTHSIIKNGIDQMLPAGPGASVEMIHGPGCPVCVTPLELIDKALAIAAQPGVIFCSFGDMLRVPGTDMDLFQVKGAGGDVRVVYSPLDAVELAAKNPGKQVVFFGVGFETTAPANAMSVHVAKRRGLKNFSVLVSHVLVPPAISAILESPGNQVQAFLLAGHVCSVMGYWEYPPVAAKYKVPLVVTGFEPLDLLDGIRRAVIQLEAGQHEVENAYERIVSFDGNQPAQKLLAEVFEVTDRAWRGIGVIPKSGWRLAPVYQDFDAESRFHITGIHTQESPLCRSGDVLRGAIKPAECGAFGKECTPRHPLGATMVSSEGACAAYYNYGRFISAEELAGAGSARSGSILTGAAHA